MTSILMFDKAIMDLVQGNLHTPLHRCFFTILTYLGENGFVWLALSIALLTGRRTRDWGIVCLFSMAICFLLGEVLLKNAIGRIRPCNEFPQIPLLIERPESFSFPSGHSGSSFAAATSIYLFCKKLGLCAFLLAFLIAFSRVFLFVHYPSDIIGGMILGIFSALVTYLVYRYWVNRRRALQER